MVDRKIDYDRGVLIMTHPQTGIDVFMYLDEPGVYLTAHAHPIAEQLAKEAGYDVEKYAKEKVRNERRAHANALIDKELDSETDVVEKVVEQKGSFTLVSIGLGRHHLKDGEGNQITAHALTEEQGKKLLDAMVLSEAPPAEVKKNPGIQKNA